MRYLVLTIFINIVLPAYSQNTISKQREAISVLQKASDKLNGLTTLSYAIKRELNYASEDFHNISEWLCYFNFDPTNATVGFKYQINDSKSSDFFNGTEKFELNKATKTIQINDNPRKEDFQSLSYLYNSIVTLRNVLPLLIADQNSNKTVTDTIINNHPYEVVTINMGKRRIQNLGEGFDEMKTKYNFIYKITIDKINNMPIEVLQKNDLNDDFIKTNFTNINFTPNQPAETSWYYSTYTKEYKPAESIVIPSLSSIGSFASDWKLTAYKDNKQFSLSNLKGKVILLDFWIKNCGSCILSVPHLNKLLERFQNMDFELISINSYDSKGDVGKFFNKHKIKYPVLLNGKTIAENYGVSAFPTFFVIDKSGKIIYSQTGFDESSTSKIEKIIKKALQ